MARYQLILAYDGTDFSGFQRQGKTRTVQSVVENALKEIDWQEDSILFAGRTDGGVHATGQVIVFSLEWQHPMQELLNALNARLPKDVVGQEIHPAEAEFHPRYDASSRTYHYSIYHAPQTQPLLDRTHWRIWPVLNGDSLNEAAAVFIGSHDFAAFGRAMKPGGTTIREVIASNWVQTSNGWRYEITANAFLYHMVRRLVFLQVQCARGTLTSRELRKGFVDKAIVKPGLAPSHGLTLVNVSYEIGRQGLVDETMIE